MAAYRYTCSCGHTTDSESPVEKCLSCGKSTSRMEYGVFGKSPRFRVRGTKHVSDRLARAFAQSKKRNEADVEKWRSGELPTPDIPRGCPDAPDYVRKHY